MILKLVLLSAMTFGSDVVIDDPRKALNNLRGEYEFSDSFTCGATTFVHSATNAAQVNCGANNCTSQIANVMMSKSSMFVEECSSNQVKIYGDQGLEFTVTKVDYDLSGKNWTIAFLKQSHQFFSSPPTKVTVEHSFPTMVEIIQNGERRNMFVDSIHVAYQFQPNTMTYGMTLYVNPLAKGLDQILILKTMNDTIYRKKGVFGDKLF